MIKLSILTPSTPKRLDNKLLILKKTLEPQLTDEVEWLIFTDNYKRSIGDKRNALLSIAQGEYIAFVDDDDMVPVEYVHMAIGSINRKSVDVITFKQLISLNEHSYNVTFRAGYPINDELTIANPMRPPWHVCFWRRELVKDIQFAPTNYGEDWHWVEQANQRIKTHHHIDYFMHHYNYNSNTSEAHV